MGIEYGELGLMSTIFIIFCIYSNSNVVIAFGLFAALLADLDLSVASNLDLVIWVPHSGHFGDLVQALVGQILEPAQGLLPFVHSLDIPDFLLAEHLHYLMDQQCGRGHVYFALNSHNFLNYGYFTFLLPRSWFTINYSFLLGMSAVAVLPCTLIYLTLVMVSISMVKLALNMYPSMILNKQNLTRGLCHRNFVYQGPTNLLYN